MPKEAKFPCLNTLVYKRETMFDGFSANRAKLFKACCQFFIPRNLNQVQIQPLLISLNLPAHQLFTIISATLNKHPSILVWHFSGRLFIINNNDNNNLCSCSYLYDVNHSQIHYHTFWLYMHSQYLS